jgi:hypothetical protein
MYDNDGKVFLVTYADSTGSIFRRVFLSFQNEKLVELERQVKVPGGFQIEKTITFSYYQDGNLADLTEHFAAVGVQSEATFTEHYEQYDDKNNVDGFSLVHDEFFDHLVLLPEVQLQKNNPGKVTRFGDGLNFSVQYTYDYNDKNLPLSKNGNLTILNGANAGQVVQTQSIFSYY